MKRLAMNRVSVGALENRKYLGITTHTFAQSLSLSLFHVESEFEWQMHGSSAGAFTQAARSGRCIFIQRLLEPGVNYEIKPLPFSGLCSEATTQADSSQEGG